MFFVCIYQVTLPTVGNRTVEAVEASEAAEADEFNEAAEISKSSKITTEDFRVIQVLEFSSF